MCYCLWTQKVLLLEYEYHLVQEDLEGQMTVFTLWYSLTVLCINYQHLIKDFLEIVLLS